MLLAVSGWLFASGLLTAVTQTATWCVIFFLRLRRRQRRVPVDGGAQPGRQPVRAVRLDVPSATDAEMTTVEQPKGDRDGPFPIPTCGARMTPCSAFVMLTNRCFPEEVIDQECFRVRQGHREFPGLPSTSPPEVDMGLSHQERQSLEEIERGLRSDDPTMAGRMAVGAPAAEGRRPDGWAWFGLLLGLQVTLAGFAATAGLISIGTIIGLYGLLLFASSAGSLLCGWPAHRRTGRILPHRRR